MKLIIKLSYAILFFIALRYTSVIYIDYLNNKYASTSKVPIEVVFVATKKDFDILPYSIASVKKYLKQPITNFVLITENNDAARKLARENDLILIDENNLINFNDFKDWIAKKNYKINHGSIGWYYQQFLKLIYSKHSTAEYYFVVDADIVFMRPFIMVSDYRVITYFIGDNLGHDISVLSVKKLFDNVKIVPDFSFISDMTCFDKDITLSLIGEIEKRFSTSFYQAAIEVEQNSKARFSEYELYGMYANFIQNRKPHVANFLERSNVASPRKKLMNNSYHVRNLYVPYIAYHHYLNK